MVCRPPWGFLGATSGCIRKLAAACTHQHAARERLAHMCGSGSVCWCAKRMHLSLAMMMMQW